MTPGRAFAAHLGRAFAATPRQGWPAGTRRAAVAAAAVVAAGLVVGALIWASLDGGSPSTGPGVAGAASTGARPGTSTGAGTGTGQSPAATGRSGPPGAAGTTGDASAAGFLTELGAIDPALVADPGRALRAGQDVCQEIKASRPLDAVVRDAIQRFGSTTVSVDETKATLIVDAARNHLCPG